MSEQNKVINPLRNLRFCKCLVFSARPSFLLISGVCNGCNYSKRNNENFDNKQKNYLSVIIIIQKATMTVLCRGQLEKMVVILLIDLNLS